MNLLDNPKYTTLLYRDAESRRRSAKPLALVKDDYYPILSYPKAEMDGDAPIDAAASFVAITLSFRWRLQLRRRIQPGDALVHAPATYMFADEEMYDYFAQHGRNALKLQRRSNLWLIEFKHEEQICKA